MVAYTCMELMMIKVIEKLAVLSFTANIPRTQVSPNRGKRMTDDFTRALEDEVHTL